MEADDLTDGGNCVVSVDSVMRDEADEPHYNEQVHSVNEDDDDGLSTSQPLTLNVGDSPSDSLEDPSMQPISSAASIISEQLGTACTADGQTNSTLDQMSSASEPVALGLEPRRSKRQRRKPTIFYQPLGWSEKSKERQKIIHDRRCFRCGSGKSGNPETTDELVECFRCPRAYHLVQCLGLDKAPKKTWMCPWHECCLCFRKASQAGGLLIHCAECPTTFCYDCFPPDYTRCKVSSEYFEGLCRKGFDVNSSKFVLFLCSRCKAFKEQERRRNLSQQQLQAELTAQKESNLKLKELTKTHQLKDKERDKRLEEKVFRLALHERKRLVNEEDDELQLRLREAYQKLFPLDFIKMVEDKVAMTEKQDLLTPNLSSDITDLPSQKKKPIKRHTATKFPKEFLPLCQNCQLPCHEAAFCPFPQESLPAVEPHKRRNDAFEIPHRENEVSDMALKSEAVALEGPNSLTHCLPLIQTMDTSSLEGNAEAATARKWKGKICSVCGAYSNQHIRKHCLKLTNEQIDEYKVRRDHVRMLIKYLERCSSVLFPSEYNVVHVDQIDSYKRRLMRDVESIVRDALVEAGLEKCIHERASTATSSIKKFLSKKSEDPGVLKTEAVKTDETQMMKKRKRPSSKGSTSSSNDTSQLPPAKSRNTLGKGEESDHISGAGSESVCADFTTNEESPPKRAKAEARLQRGKEGFKGRAREVREKVLFVPELIEGHPHRQTSTTIHSTTSTRKKVSAPRVGNNSREAFSKSKEGAVGLSPENHRGYPDAYMIRNSVVGGTAFSSKSNATQLCLYDLLNTLGEPEESTGITNDTVSFCKPTPARSPRQNRAVHDNSTIDHGQEHVSSLFGSFGDSEYSGGAYDNENRGCTFEGSSWNKAVPFAGGVGPWPKQDVRHAFHKPPYDYSRTGANDSSHTHGSDLSLNNWLKAASTTTISHAGHTATSTMGQQPKVVTGGVSSRGFPLECSPSPSDQMGGGFVIGSGSPSRRACAALASQSAPGLVVGRPAVDELDISEGRKSSPIRSHMQAPKSHSFSPDCENDARESAVDSRKSNSNSAL